VRGHGLPTRLHYNEGVTAALRGFLWLLQRAFIASYSNNVLLYAKSASYSGLLCFLPLLGTVAAVLVQVRATEVSALLANLLGMVVPPGTEGLISFQFAAYGERPTALLVGAGILSWWAASSVMASLMEGFDACYHIPVARSFLKQRVVAVLLVLFTGIPVILASVLIIFGGYLAEMIVARIAGVGFETLGAGVRWSWSIGRNVIGLGAIVLVTACMYYFGPNRDMRWRDAFPGAFVATALWYITVVVFAWYVENIADYNLLYGSLGAGIALLVWMFAMSNIALYGCAFNAERERILRLRKQA
jgi:membrane protein